MNVPAVIVDAIAALPKPGGVREVADLTGGCIHRVLRVTLDDGRAFVAKIADADTLTVFEEEAVGLHALADTRTVVTPRPLDVRAGGGQAVLLIEAVESAPASDQGWRRFGEDLAALHERSVSAGSHDAGGSSAHGSRLRYGFPHDNHLGTTPQPNAWCDDWVRFNAERRLGHQLRLATTTHALTGDEADLMQRVIDRLDLLIPRTPRPSLLHGDLWSGNALPTRDDRGNDRVAVIDPACSIGDGWADIAMMRLFGGFPDVCFDAYRGSLHDPPPRDDVDMRMTVYQLYHVLNHVNIFGRTYASQATALARRLV